MGRACGEHAYKKEYIQKFRLGNLKVIPIRIYVSRWKYNTKVELKYS